MFIAKALECLIFYLLYSLAMTGPQIKELTSSKILNKVTIVMELAGHSITQIICRK